MPCLNCGSELDDAKQRKAVIGLIGGMGSGKSSVAALFAQRGAKLISGDRLGHEALQQPQIKARIIERWGKEVLDDQGNIERQKLAAIVFADAAERRALEAMVFPWIERGIQEEVAAAIADDDVKLIVLDAAIMLETGWNKICDRLIYVQAPRETRLRRLAEQRGWNAKEVEARENAQMSLSEKITHADYAIDNSGSPEQTTKQVDELLRQWGLLKS